MSAQYIFDNATLGSMVQYADGTPKPPARFTKKLDLWARSNGSGRLVRKSAGTVVGNYPLPSSITLHQGNLSSGGIVLVVMQRSFSIDTCLQFDVI